MINDRGPFTRGVTPPWPARTLALLIQTELEREDCRGAEIIAEVGLG